MLISTIGLNDFLLFFFSSDRRNFRYSFELTSLIKDWILFESTLGKLRSMRNRILEQLKRSSNFVQNSRIECRMNGFHFRSLFLVQIFVNNQVWEKSDHWLISHWFSISEFNRLAEFPMSVEPRRESIDSQLFVVESKWTRLNCLQCCDHRRRCGIVSKVERWKFCFSL